MVPGNTGTLILKRGIPVLAAWARKYANIVKGKDNKPCLNTLPREKPRHTSRLKEQKREAIPEVIKIGTAIHSIQMRYTGLPITRENLMPTSGAPNVKSGCNHTNTFVNAFK